MTKKNLIDRSALLENLEEYIEYDTFDQYKEEPLINLSFEQLEDIICSQPTVEAKPIVRGEWIDNGITDSILSKCSVCEYSCGAYSFNFCPNCGASMTGEDARSKYEIDLEGCDDSTVFEMMLSDAEYQALLKVAKKANDTSTYTCMPRMYVNKADMRGEKND